MSPASRIYFQRERRGIFVTLCKSCVYFRWRRMWQLHSIRAGGRYKCGPRAGARTLECLEKERPLWASYTISPPSPELHHNARNCSKAYPSPGSEAQDPRVLGVVRDNATTQKETGDAFVQVLDARKGVTCVPREDRLTPEDWLVLRKSAETLKPSYEHTMRFQSRAKQGHHGAHLGGLAVHGNDSPASGRPAGPRRLSSSWLIAFLSATMLHLQLNHIQNGALHKPQDEWRNGDRSVTSRLPIAPETPMVSPPKDGEI